MDALAPRSLHRLAASLFLLGLSGAAAFAAPITFRDSRSYDLGGGFRQVLVAGDFDGDHQSDIATAHDDGSVLWSTNSHGALGAPQPVATPFLIHGLAAGDLNGDGRADLVGCDAAAANGALAILFSNGAGFDPAIVVPTDSAGVTGVTLADLDGDGDLDIVAANLRTCRVSRLFNDGAGHFSGLASTFVTDPAGRTWVADLNGDGRPDILTGIWIQSSAGFNVPARFLAGTGGGAFAAPVLAGVVAPIALGRFSGPGSLDLLVGNTTAYGIARGLGNGSFAPPVFTPSAGLGSSCSTLPWGAPIDLEGDGRDELIVGSDCTVATYGILHVAADLSLVRRESPRGDLGLVPAVADLDGDGHLDAVLANMQVALNRDSRLSGLRTLRGTREWQSDMVTQDLDVGDLNGDGAADIVVTDKFSSGYLFMSNHDGSFQKSTPWQAQTYIRQSALADLDGDGRLDALEVHADPGLSYGLYSALGDGVGHFGPANFLPSSPLAFVILTADFDGDGDVDALLQQATGVLCMNDGLGHMTPQNCSLPVSGTYGRVDGDALPARFTTSGDALSVERATAVGVLGAPTLTPVGATLTTARFADVNGDGLTDAVCLVNGAQVETFLAQPGGGWGPPFVSPESPIAPGYTPVFAGLGDLDADGRPDLVFTGPGGYPISVMRNLGGGGFGQRGDTFTTWLGSPMIADADGDGAGDLVGLNQFVYLHASQGNLIQSTADVLFGSAPAQIPTPALVSLASASAAIDRATIAWWVPSDGPTLLNVERRAAGSAWSTVATATPSGGRVLFEDRAVEAGASYDWRLAWSESGVPQHSEVASLSIPRRSSFAIAGLRPNPVDGDHVRVDFTIDRVAPLEVKVVDVSGRVVASRRIEAPALGRASVDFDEFAGARAGLYFVRAELAGRQVTTTLVRLR